MQDSPGQNCENPFATKTIPRQPPAASGLGRESAVRLAKAGATVVLTTRSEAKGKKAVEEVNLGLQHFACHMYPRSRNSMECHGMSM